VYVRVLVIIYSYRSCLVQVRLNQLYDFHGRKTSGAASELLATMLVVIATMNRRAPSRFVVMVLYDVVTIHCVRTKKFQQEKYW
jgi:hypothetical protein